MDASRSGETFRFPMGFGKLLVMWRLTVIAALLLTPALVFSQGVYGRRTTRGGSAGTVDAPPPTFTGKLKAITKKDIVVEVEGEAQSLTFHLSRKTRFMKAGKEIKLDDLEVGKTVAVDAKRDPDLQFSALTVVVDPPKPKEQQTEGPPDRK
jgi:hypothetical protein